MNRKLIRLLKQAHAIEVGAYHAYEGHWRSLANKHLDDALQVVKIQSEEQMHRLTLERHLRILKSKPNKALDAIFWCVGKTISASCYVIGYRAGMWGAKIMERLGASCYDTLAEEAWMGGHLTMRYELEEMQRAEERHELFFKGVK